MYKILVRCLVFLFLSANEDATAQQNSISEIVNSMPLVGRAEFNFIFWKVYEAELYSTADKYQHFEVLPFALKLTYKRRFSQQQMLQETQKQFIQIGVEANQTESWLERLSNIYPDVEAEDALLLYVDPEGSSNFYLNEEYLGSIQDILFSKQFSAIWLARNNRYADFTRSLTGK